MKSGTVEKQLQKLDGRRAEAEERLTQLQEEAGRVFDVDRQAELRGQIAGLREEIAAIDAAAGAGQQELARAQAEEKAKREANWRDRLHPTCVQELEKALGDMLQSLKALRASWDKYLEAKNAWVERWIAEGRFQPGVPNPAGADSLGAYLSVVQARQGGSPSAQKLDEEARRLLLGPAEVVDGRRK